MTKTSVSVRFSEEELDDLEKYVEESVVFEDRSQAIRSAVRQMVQDGTGEFEKAQ